MTYDLKTALDECETDDMPIIICTECFRAYKATTNICPWCDHKAEPDEMPAKGTVS